MGYVPVAAEDEADVRIPNGYTVGVYVGFDDNRRMVRSSTHITGAAGALPTWTTIAQDIVDLSSQGDYLDIADLSFNGLSLRYPDVGEVFVPVDPDQGGHIIPGRGALKTFISPTTPSVLTYGNAGEGGHFEPKRFFLPYWKTQQ